ncbi:Hpt domain-containing protein [Paeniglutamicibacter sp.]|uniref:Hpt domain-containing protein n=1 Tax=Paeniglutamicibacter sp. TaxID=1934391 RepID=UPI00398A5090
MELQPISPDAAVCAQTLGKLCSEVGPQSVNEFIAQFSFLWPTRIARLRRALASNDRAAGEDAALSLKSAATMAGAHDLATLAVQLHEAFRDDHEAVQGELIGRIERAGNAILAVLTEPGFVEHALGTYRQSA